VSAEAQRRAFDPVRALLLALGIAFALFLLLQSGNLLDEPEHLHSAWLISERGMRPIHDFFEHHTPLLWYALGLFYKLGVGGPEGMWAGRGLVIACAAGWIAMLVVVVRRWSGGTARKPGLFGFVCFVLTAMFARELFVIRPETLAALLFAGALVAWTSRFTASAAAAGFFFAASCFAGPRTVLLAPVFLLADAAGKPSLAFRRWIAAAAGTAVAAALFFAFVCPLQDFLFDLRYSSILQHVGVPPAVDLRYAGAALVIACLLGSALLSTSTAPRRLAALWIAHGAAIWAFCTIGAGGYYYMQAFAPGLIWFSLFIAWIEAQPAVPTLEAPREMIRTGALIGALGLAGLQLLYISVDPSGAMPLTVSRRMLLDALPRGEKVFLLSTQHPIAAEDVSYWGGVLLDDSPGKICSAAATYSERFPDAAIHLRPCDFAGDLKRGEPWAVSRLLYIAAPLPQIDEVMREISLNYASLNTLDDAPSPSIRSNVLFRAPKGYHRTVKQGVVTWEPSESAK
jgi:hypothetical protein